MRMSARGLRALMDREGFKNEAYPDPNTKGPPWTIGVGHTGPEVHPGLRWSDEQVMAALRADVRRFEDGLDAIIKVKVTQNQWDALVSWAFNVPGWERSTLLRKLNAGDVAGASAEFRKWIIPSMITPRRAGEWVQFNTPDGQPYPARSQFDARFP